LGRKRTGSCQVHQKLVTRALKRARHMALLPFVPTT
jgi:ribosomal protein S18